MSGLWKEVGLLSSRDKSDPSEGRSPKKSRLRFQPKPFPLFWLLSLPLSPLSASPPPPSPPPPPPSVPPPPPTPPPSRYTSKMSSILTISNSVLGVLSPRASQPPEAVTSFSTPKRHVPGSPQPPPRARFRICQRNMKGIPSSLIETKDNRNAFMSSSFSAFFPKDMRTDERTFGRTDGQT